MSDKKQISWTAPEFIHYPKSPMWFISLGLAGLAVIAYFLLQRDFLTAVMFLLLVITVYFFAKAKPRTMEIALDSHGVKISKMQIPYQRIKSFWIVYQPPETKTLNFETAAYLNRFLTLQLENEDPVAIRDFLLEYLPEDLDRTEQLTDKISRTLKF